MRAIAAAAVGLMMAGWLVPHSAPARDIVWILVDDLRPLLGCYGEKNAHTPNLDRLAQEGVRFERAYCQAAKCGPSRISMLSGLRPETTRVWSHKEADWQRFRQRQADWKSLPQALRAAGWTTRAFGKVSHDGWVDDADWSLPAEPGREGEMLEIVDEAALKNVPYAERAQVPTLIADRKKCPAIQAADVPDDALFAGRMTHRVREVLQQAGPEPHFLAIGYRRPHLPMVAPSKYFDLHPAEQQILPSNRQPPKGAPWFAWFNSDGYQGMIRQLKVPVVSPPTDAAEAMEWNGFELRSYLGVPTHGPIPDDRQREIWQAYRACISYVDAQIGLLLQALRQHPRWRDAAVVVTSDHGWHLGDQTAWTKMTNYEVATRVPLLIHVPGVTPAGAVIRQPVELLDLAPTFLDCAGLPIPKALEGHSLLPLLQNPDTTDADAVACSSFPRFQDLMGQAARDARYRYVRWLDASTGRLRGEELYDHEVDPGETVNRAPQHPEICQRLATRLDQVMKRTEPQKP
ncbi:MAG: sulfatase [Verrucomicrobiales bacterium]|nr:sulfatase [Verrucomicrobiales bacterium]